VYCFDTDVVSALGGHRPPLHLVRRLSLVPVEEQFITAVTLAELLYGAERVEKPHLVERARSHVPAAQHVLPFDEAAAKIYGPLRARLEREGRRLADADLMIAATVLSRDLTLVTGNVRHFGRVPGLHVENWLES